MNDREALAALIDVAPISETSKAHLLAELPSMSDEDVKKLGEVFAKEELGTDEKIDKAIEQMDIFLKEFPKKESERGLV